MSRSATSAGDGVSIYLSSLDNLGAFTFAGWFYASGDILESSTVSVFDKSCNLNKDRTIISFEISTNTITATRSRTGTSAEATSQQNVYSNNTWFHVIVTSDSTGALKLYRDGTEVTYTTNTSGTGSLDPGTNTKITILNSNSNDETFSGRAAEIGLWGRVLSISEIKNIVVNRWQPSMISDDLLVYLKLSGDTPEIETISGLTASLIGTNKANHTPGIINEITNTSAFAASNYEHSFDQGIIISQPVTNVNETISKVSLYLSGNSSDGIMVADDDNDDYIAFSCLNFYEISDGHAWTIYNNVSSYTVINTCDQGYLTNSNGVLYGSTEDVFISAPSVKYKMIIKEGTFDVWCRCGGSEIFWYAWDNDEIPSKITLNSTIKWLYLGRIFNEEETQRTLNIYLGIGDPQQIKLDQIYLSLVGSERNIDTLSSIQKQNINTYNTFMRARELSTDGSTQAMPAGDISGGHNWLTSREIGSPGWYNYPISDHKYEGLSIDFIVISGDINSHPQWIYAKSVDSAAYKSTNWGLSFSKL